MATVGPAFGKVPWHPRNHPVPSGSSLASNWVGEFCLGQYLDNVLLGIHWLPVAEETVPTIPIILLILIPIV